MISPTMRSGTPTQRNGKKTIPTMVRTAPTMSNNAPEVSWSVKSVPPRSEKGRTHSPCKNVLRFVPFVPASAGVWSGGARRGVPPCGLTWYKYSRPYPAPERTSQEGVPRPLPIQMSRSRSRPRRPRRRPCSGCSSSGCTSRFSWSPCGYIRTRGFVACAGRSGSRSRSLSRSSVSSHT